MKWFIITLKGGNFMMLSLDKENVVKALSICVPETQDDSKLECSDCPYGAVCNPNDIVGIPLPLIWDIRALLKEQEGR